jgi:anti-sigma regulatory factor (Ser/Thr protein kinase)
MEIGSPIVVGGPMQRTAVSDMSQVGQSRRIAQRLAEVNGFDAVAAGRVGIVATELATNLLRHAGGGEMLSQILADDASAQVELIAVDRGPGMSNIAQAMRDGYSTTGTAGTGLGAVSRLSRFFDIYSAPGSGTVVVARVGPMDRMPAQPVGTRFQIGSVCRAVDGEFECGDSWRCAVSPDTLSVMVVDGLGHGALAARAAHAAVATFANAPLDAPAALMQRAHSSLTGGRGAAAACASVDIGSGKIRYCGIGNISGRVSSSESSRGMVSHNGILGVQTMRQQEFNYDWPETGLIIMHSDGLSARFSLADYPGLATRHSALIAGVLYRDHARARDDATIVVIGRKP